jgi:erythromycin esterase-like protein
VHAARAPGANPVLGVQPIGTRVAGRWGDRLAAIGFTALRGEWSRAREPIKQLAPLPPEALEARALAAAGDGAGWAYLDRAALRSLGTAPSRLFGPVTTADWSAAFDGVVVIRDEAAPTFEQRR